MMKVDRYLRLAFMFSDNQSTTFLQNLLKMIRLTLFETIDSKGLTIIEIIEHLKEQYGLLFSDKEITEAINKKGSNIICLNDDKEDNVLCRKYYIELNEIEKIAKKVEDNVIVDVVKRFLIVEENCEYSEDEFKNLLDKFLYNVFNSNAETILNLLNGKSEELVFDDNFEIKEKEIINRFLLWKDSAKDKCIYQMVSCCFDYCMMTLKKDNNIYRNIFNNKNFYLDTNIVFRLMGLNHEERKKILFSFIDKCKEAGITLKYTNFTKKEIDNTINHYVNQINKVLNNQHPLDRQALKLMDPYIVKDDFYDAYIRWCKEPQNTPGNYKDFELYLKKEADRILSKFRMEVFDDKSIKNSRDFQFYVKNLSSYKISKKGTINDESIKVDINNFLFMVELNNRDKGSDFFSTHNYIISADHIFGEWIKKIRPAAVPVVVLPSVWYSIILQYHGRTEDDQSSFTKFLKFSMSNDTGIPDKRKQMILEHILKNVPEKAEVKNKMIFDISEKLQTEYKNIESIQEVVEISHRYILEDEIKKVHDAYNNKFEEREASYKKEMADMKEQVDKVESEKEKEKEKIRKETEKNTIEKLVDGSLKKTIIKYYILFSLFCGFIGIGVLCLLKWLSSRPDIFFTKGIESVINLIGILLTIGAIPLSALIFNKVFLSLNKDKIRDKLQKKIEKRIR